LTSKKKGVGTLLTAIVVVLLIVAAALAVLYAGASRTTTTVTAVSTQTTSASVTSTVISVSTEVATSNITTTLTTSVPMGPLISYSADAYATETSSLLTGFSKTTGIPTAPVISGGSNADASSIEAGAPDDVFVSAALPATAPSHLGNLSADWAIGFATDQVVVAYSNATLSDSAASAVVSLGQSAEKSNTTSDWNTFYAALTSGSTKVGISNPVADPGGLRGWLVLEAAGFLYDGNQSAYVSSLLTTQGNVTGTSSAALVAPLQSGQIQFLFIYKSAAISDGIGYISLDDHVNLSDARLASYYSQFSYTDSSGKTAGAPIVLVVTVPSSSVNTAEALEFVQYVVKNMRGLSGYGLVIPKTALLYSSLPSTQSLPQPIQALLSEGLLVQAGPI
jgi:molybdate/tungstate transport system substrate-binding protein